MDIFENRRRWLAHWVETDFDGNKAAAAEGTGYSRSQISQFLSPTYQGGESPQEKAARRIEKKFKKQPRIMETPAPGSDFPSIEGHGGFASILNLDGVPAYVSDALHAILGAHAANMPRELFDAVTVIFTLRPSPKDANIKPSLTDETKPPSSMASIKQEAANVMETGEDDLAARGGGTSGTRRGAGRKSKGARH